MFNPAQSLAQFYDYVPVGARSIGMGGTGIASSRGGEAIYHNPALMGMEGNSYLTLSIRFRNEEVINGNGSPSAPLSEHLHLGSHLAALVVPFPVQNKRFTFGIAHIRSMEPLLFKDDGTGGVHMLSPTFSMRITEKLRAGVAVNGWTGALEYKSLGVGTPDVFSDATFSGLNSTLGVSYLLFQKYQQHKVFAGVVARTPFDLKSNDRYVFAYDGGMAFGSETVSITVPATIGIGISWVYNRLTTINVDYEYRAVDEQTLNKWIEQFTYTPESLPLSLQANTTHHLGLGFEHVLQVAEARIPLRMGYCYFNTQLLDTSGERVNAEALSLGIGFESEVLRLDIGYQLHHYTNTVGSPYDYGQGSSLRAIGYKFSTAVVGLSVNIEELW